MLASVSFKNKTHLFNLSKILCGKHFIIREKYKKHLNEGIKWKIRVVVCSNIKFLYDQVVKNTKCNIKNLALHFIFSKNGVNKV